VHLELAAAVGALLPLLCQPLLDAVPAAELRAGGAQDCILDFTVTDETLEDFVNILVCGDLGFFTMATVGSEVLLNYAASVCTLDGANISKSLPVTLVKGVTHRNNIIVVVDVLKRVAI
jgi:hypothetical protein